MNINKISPSKKTNASFQQDWLKDMLKHADRLVLRQDAQLILQKLSQVPTIEMQKRDLEENSQLLLQRPLTRLQTQRLFQTYNDQTHNLKNTYQAFREIWQEQCVIHPSTLQLIDPKYVSPRFANADAARYREYLMHLLFMKLCCASAHLHDSQEFAYFVEWMNGIEYAQTTAKLTLRSQPNIQSEVLIELPKHSLVSVYHDENSLWKKIRLNTDREEQFGYVMSAYLKF